MNISIIIRCSYVHVTRDHYHISSEFGLSIHISFFTAIDFKVCAPTIKTSEDKGAEWDSEASLYFNTLQKLLRGLIQKLGKPVTSCDTHRLRNMNKRLEPSR
jgi:hypothetical protein